MDVTKIITVTFGDYGSQHLSSVVYKEDRGLVLQIADVELPEAYEVDFSNSEFDGDSITMIGNADGVDIPAQFLKSRKDVFAFLVVHPDGDSRRTIRKYRIPVASRPARTDEEPTPEQATLIEQAISALNLAVATTAQDVETTASNAQASAESAASAAASAQSAEDARDAAEGYAQNASDSASAAATSASQASTSASTASTAATSANASAASAYADAERAEQAASTAGYLDVEIVDGRLIYTRTDAVDVDFALDNGRLIMEVI